jgi:hypothetical protein
MQVLRRCPHAAHREAAARTLSHRPHRALTERRVRRSHDLGASCLPRASSPPRRGTWLRRHPRFYGSRCEKSWLESQCPAVVPRRRTARSMRSFERERGGWSHRVTPTPLASALLVDLRRNGDSRLTSSRVRRHHRPCRPRWLDHSPSCNRPFRQGRSRDDSKDDSKDDSRDDSRENDGGMTPVGGNVIPDFSPRRSPHKTPGVARVSADAFGGGHVARRCLVAAASVVRRSTNTHLVQSPDWSDEWGDPLPLRSIRYTLPQPTRYP